MSITQRYAGMLRRNAGEWDKREMPVQAECVRQAARHMEKREQALAAEIAASFLSYLYKTNVDVRRYV